MVAEAGVETQDRLRASAAVFPVLVCPVPLGVVVFHPSLVRLHQLLPAFGLREVVVGHSPLDVERRLDVGLVRLSPLDLLFAYAQGGVDGFGLSSLENGASVGYEPLRRAVAFDGRVENAQEGARILPARDGAGEDRPAVVLKDRDD